MQYTENYKLNLIEPSDPFSPDALNENVKKLETELARLDAAKGNCRIFMGSYTGTGTYGQNNPNTLTFDFEPKILLLHVHAAFSYGSHMVWYRGGTGYSHPGNLNSKYYITWEGNTVSWYQTFNSTSSGTGQSYQMNEEGQEYFYIAIG